MKRKDIYILYIYIKNIIYCNISTYNTNTFNIPKNQNKEQQKIFTGIVIEDKNNPSIDKNYNVNVHLYFNQNNTTANNTIKARICNSNSGSKYGTWYVPRGGQEVIVMFLDELLSYPIIIGSMYSNDIQPHYNSKYANLTYWRSETIKKEGQKNDNNYYANEIFMDDTHKSEILRIGARLNCEFLVTKNMDIKIKEKTNIQTNDCYLELETLKIKESKSTNIDSEETKINVKNNYSLKADNTSITNQNNMDIKNNNTKIKSNVNTQIESNMIKIDGQTINIDSKSIINIKCGSSSIMISSTSIIVKATSLVINGQSTTCAFTSLTVQSTTGTFMIPSFTLQGGNNMIIGMTMMA